ncbi:MAG: PQQ-binding-like beta-propeller repeat protein, partial [Nitrososphaera sp.]
MEKISMNITARPGSRAFVFLSTLILLSLVCVLSFAMFDAHAGDWPEWRGPGRRGVWLESGLLDTFPKAGLAIKWRTPIHGGYAGPAVADSRVFVTDFAPLQNLKGIERILCLDEKTGRVLWTREWEADYTGLMK